jgi:hydroxymethylpyrimidine pyrophosphatase-like HAD family hydrolase
MVRLFVSDIDGCLSEPFVPFDLGTLDRIRELVAAGAIRSVPDTPPAFSICTGRPLGYAEAVAQALGVRIPFLFEAGGGMYDPLSGLRRWHPNFGPDDQSAVADIQHWLESRTRGTTLSVDRGKHTQAGLIGAEESEIMQELGPVTEFVREHHPEFTVAHTAISIDIMSARLTKREGLTWLASEVGVGIQDLAFIGDSNGDLGGLGLAGTSFAPANATGEVRNAVSTVTRGRAADGVLEAYLECIERNSY